MILHFININRVKLAIIFFVVLSPLLSNKVFSRQQNKFFLPDQSGYIFGRCNNDLCNIYLKKKNADPIILLKKSSFPSIEVVSKNLVRLFFSCGSPCNYTIFFDSKIGISQPFEFEVAVNTKSQVVVVAKNNHLEGYKIFNKVKKPLFSVKRDWSPTVTLFSDIIEAKFVKDALYLKYLEGRNFKEKIEVIYDIEKREAQNK